MAFKLTAPLEKEFALEETDKFYSTGGGTMVRIRQATQREHERRSRFFAQIIQRVEPDEQGKNMISYIQNFCLPELMRIEAYLTMVDSNILDENSNPLFKPGMTEGEFMNAWGKLPQIVAYEIHEKVLEVNPDWIPLGGQLTN